MFPWNYGFQSSTGSVLFLGAFYTVLTVVVATLVSALLRARRTVAAQQTEDVRWLSTFHDLPAGDRLCRHVLTGEFLHRECPNAFDCRRCETHANLMASRPPGVSEDGGEEVFGMPFPHDRFYHRGHTWVRPESDGTVTVGLDELGRRLLGTPDRVELPPPGAKLQTNGTAFHIYKRNADVRLLSPVDGEVVEPGAPGCDWYLRVKPEKNGFDLRHLLVPCEVKPWLLRELEHLQLTLSAEGVPALADGGVPVEDIAASCPDSDWDAVCSEMFLQA